MTVIRSTTPATAEEIAQLRTRLEKPAPGSEAPPPINHSLKPFASVTSHDGKTTVNTQKHHSGTMAHYPKDLVHINGAECDRKVYELMRTQGQLAAADNVFDPFPDQSPQGGPHRPDRGVRPAPWPMSGEGNGVSRNDGQENTAIHPKRASHAHADIATARAQSAQGGECPIAVNAISRVPAHSLIGRLRGSSPPKDDISVTGLSWLLSHRSN